MNREGVKQKIIIENITKQRNSKGRMESSVS